MIDHPDGVIDLERTLRRRLRRKALPLGVEVRATGRAFALYGPDRDTFLYPRGLGERKRWLSYEEASEVLERHIASPSADG